MNPNRKKDAMKKVIVAGLALFLVSSCTRVVEVESIATDPPATKAPPTTSYAPPAPKRGTNTELLDMVYEMHPAARDMGLDADIIAAATSTCDALDNGASIYEVAANVGDAASDQDSMDLLAAVAVAGIMVKCPEYTYLLESLGDY